MVEIRDTKNKTVDTKSGGKKTVTSCPKGYKLVDGRCVKEKEAKEKQEKPTTKERKLLGQKRVAGGKEVTGKEFQQAKVSEAPAQRSEELKQVKREKGFITAQDVEQYELEAARKEQLQQETFEQMVSPQEAEERVAIDLSLDAKERHIREQANVPTDVPFEDLNYEQQVRYGQIQRRIWMKNIRSQIRSIPAVGELLVKTDTGAITKGDIGSLDKRREVMSTYVQGVTRDDISRADAIYQLTLMEAKLEEDINNIQLEAIENLEFRGTFSHTALATTYEQQKNFLIQARGALRSGTEQEFFESNIDFIPVEPIE